MSPDSGLENDTLDSLDIPIVSNQTEDILSERELVDYREHKGDVLEWALHVGKDPQKAEGYATSTVHQLSYQLGSFYRWLWTANDGYTTDVSPEDADDYMEAVAYNNTSNGHKATAQKCLKRLMRYRERKLGESHDWEPDRTFSEPQTNPRDFLTPDERTAIREAALEYGSVPSYNSLSPEERDEWKGHLSQRHDKPKSAIGPQDFERTNGWKFPCLVWASLDTGLRPIEVGRATTTWVDVENKLLRIPKEDSSKNADNWTVAVTDRTAAALER